MFLFIFFHLYLNKRELKKKIFKLKLESCKGVSFYKVIRELLVMFFKIYRIILLICYYYMHRM